MKKRALTLLVITAVVTGLMYAWFKDATKPVDVRSDTYETFVISKGESVREVIDKLKKGGLIRDPLAFFMLLKFQRVEKSIQAGDFRLRRNMNAQEIIDELQHGTLDIWVTVLEGWRKEEIALELARTLSVPEAEFLKYAEEGYLFPDTYLFPREASASAIVKTMKDNFDKKVGEAVADEASKKNLTVKELITFASLVEREGKTDEDRPIIAGILYNRLRDKWALQVDATLQYILGYQSSEKKWWKSELTADDKNIKSPYNTYLNTGLPPDPICNPGLASIKAVLNPQQTDYYYYLHGKDGTARYAVTNEEHEANKLKYL